MSELSEPDEGRPEDGFVTIGPGGHATPRSEAFPTGIADGPVTAEPPSRASTMRRWFPSALAMALAVGAILESAVFRQAYMLADRSTVAIAYKGNRLEQGRSDQVVILGPSTALAIDASRLQQSLPTRVSIYNYALPNLGSTQQYYFVLKKYLQFNRRPDRIVLALPPDSILNESAEGSEPFIEEVERQRFRRFFGPVFLLTDVAPATHDWSFVKEAAATMLPSVNYRVFIKNAIFAPEKDEMSDWEDVGSARALYRRNRQIVKRLDGTNGQLVYYGDRIVGASEIERALPPPPSLDSKSATFVEDAIRLADSSGIGTTLVFTPVCCERERRLEENGTWTLLLRLVHAYEERYPTFRFVDASERSYANEYFGDAVHVNEQGARRLNSELVAQLPDILSPKPASGLRRPTPVLP
jgi:hypothetical protein